MNAKSRVLVAQLGARRHYAVPVGLHRSGLLEGLVTDSCVQVSPWRYLDACLPKNGRSAAVTRLTGRRVPEIPADRIKGFAGFTVSDLWRRRRGEPQTDYWARRNEAFCERVVRNGFGRADAVYAFNGAALEIFRAARQRGLRTILDQTAAPWRWNARLLDEERQRWPGWEDKPAEIDASGHLMEREEAEWELADVILCGSTFCRDALVDSGVPAGKCRVLPYPVSISADTMPEHTTGGHKPVRVLFVGTLQLRKGVQYLYDAVRQLRPGRAEVRLVGPSLLSPEANRTLAESCELVGAVPRSSMTTHYEWADIFVLPTLSEGSANVCHEAMAAGLPVITTSAAGSTVQDRINGLIVPARDAEALVEAILWLAHDPEARHRFGEAARTSMSQVLELDLYPDQLRSLLERVALESHEH